MNIKKTDMRNRVNAIANAAPSLEARFAQATAAVAEHQGIAPSASKAAGLDATPDASGTIGKKGPTGKPRHVSAPIDQIDSTKSNARRIYRAERVHELANSMRANGQETPGFATMRNGRYLLAAGGYRIRALRSLTAPTMELLVWDDLTDREIYELSYRENVEREGQSSFDNALTWRQLIDDGVYAGETEIAQATGHSLSNVNKTLAALKLSAPIVNLISEDPDAFKLSVLYELYLFEQAAGETKALALARQVLDGAIGRKQIEEARAQLVDAKPRKIKEQSRQYRIDGAGLQNGVLKEWDSGKIALELEVTDPAKRAQLVERLRDLLDTQGKPVA